MIKKHTINQPTPEPSSFRDPSGFLFYKNQTLYRQINASYQTNYQHLMDSGLYNILAKDRLLIPHIEVNLGQKDPQQVCNIIKPEALNFVSYPYEWSFSQLKDAALTTLKIHQIALAHSMTLKDASAYNIQFYQGKPILIDTLSFETYDVTKPWIAYKQFCQHFLAPLALMAYTDVRLCQLLRIYLDGIPLDLASRLLPKTTLINPGIATHIHLHAKTQQRFAGNSQAVKTTSLKMTKNSMLGLIDNLLSTVQKLSWKHAPKATEWGDYYTFTNYSTKAFEHKKQIITEWVKQIHPKTVWDLGANDGQFSRLASIHTIPTVAFDIDPVAVEKNYLITKVKQESNLLPLVLDLTNPSPAIGWANTERKTLTDRGPADLVFALALVHHLAISNNVPLIQIAQFFAVIGQHLILEFVPKTDSKVQQLLATREDIFPHYDLKHVIAAFSSVYNLVAKVPIKESKRTLLLFKPKKNRL